MEEQIQNQIREIKGSLRLLMNGAAATAMRSRGIEYKLNFGVTVPELARLSESLPHEHHLAQALWKEDIRECKMLAAMLQPAETFYPEIADIWAESVKYSDLAEVCCQYLFRRLPYASELAFQWIAQESEMLQYCGFLIMARLMRSGQEMNPRYAGELLDNIQAAISGTALLPRQGALAAQSVYNEVYNDGKGK